MSDLAIKKGSESNRLVIFPAFIFINICKEYLSENNSWFPQKVNQGFGYFSKQRLRHGTLRLFILQPSSIDIAGKQTSTFNYEFQF